MLKYLYYGAVGVFLIKCYLSYRKDKDTFLWNTNEKYRDKKYRKMKEAL